MTIINAYWTGVITQTGIMMIAIIGISLLTGFTGIFSMGHAGFMCIGGYVSALLVKSVGLPIWVGIIGGMLASMLFGLIIAVPTMKMDGDYFLIASIGIGEAVRLLVENTYNLTGGSTGMMDIGRINSLGLVLLLDVVVILFAVFFLRSKYGRNCIAVRDNEVAATAMGIDVYRTKIIVFMISCAIVALSGALLGHYLNYINPKIYNAKKSSELIMTVIMGGQGSLSGSIIAGLILTPLPELLRTESAQEWRMAIYGVLIVLVIMFRPNGLMGGKEINIKGMIRFFKEKREKVTAKVNGTTEKEGIEE